MRQRVISNASTGDVESNSQDSSGCYRAGKEKCLKLIKPDSKLVNYWRKFFVISCLAGFFVDPLFFFTLSVNQDYKCIFFNRTFAIKITIFRSVIDFVYLLHILNPFRLKDVVDKWRVKHKDFDVRKKIAYNSSLCFHFFLNLLVLPPVPQVIVFIPAYSGDKEANLAKKLLVGAILIQNVPRMMKLYHFSAGRSSSKFIFESVWSSFAVNLLMYVLGGHVAGSVWYLFGFQRVNDCLRHACSTSKITNCSVFLDCGRGENFNIFTQYPDWESWKKNDNPSSCLSEGGTFKYGIYKHAPGIAKQRKLFKRYIFSLFWGFQQISSLARNQDPSFSLWDILFLMAIIMLGLLLFAILIGNVQQFLRSLRRRRREMRLRRRDVKKLMSRLQLPKNLKSKVKEAEEKRWVTNFAVHDEELLKSLPENLQWEIRPYLFEFPEKVKIFSLMDRPMLYAFRRILRHKSYTAESYVQNKGGPIDKMVFIVKGELVSIGADRNPSLLHEGDVCGEELLAWYLENASLKDGENIQGPTQRLLSNRDVKCTTNVEAFVLQYSDRVDLNINVKDFLQKQRVQEVIRSMIRQGGLEVP